MEKEARTNNLTMNNTRLRIFLILLSCTMFVGWIDPASDINEEGIKLYNEEKYDEAISKFTDAQSFVPESQSLDFNIANTHYKEGKLPEAEKSFKDTMKTEDKILKANANYNMGNTMYKQGKLKESLDFYKKAIQLAEEKGNLEDGAIASLREDSKYNYEFVQKKIEEMEKQQQERQEQEKQEQEEQDEQQEQEQQQDQKGQDEQDKQDKQENKEQDKDNQDKQDQEQKKQQEQQDKQDEQEKKEQDKGQSQENEKEGQQPPPPPEKREMTKEEAERLLDAMKQAEMAARHAQEKEHNPSHFKIEKDW